MPTSDENRVHAEAEAITRRADLERRAPKALQAVDNFLALCPPSYFCTSCDRRAKTETTCCPDGRVVRGIPPNVRCHRCWGGYGENVCDGKHPGAVMVGQERYMTPAAMAIEAEEDALEARRQQERREGGSR